MKKKKFLAFTLCSLLTLTSIQEPLAFSDETPDDPAFLFFFQRMPRPVS